MRKECKFLHDYMIYVIMTSCTVRSYSIKKPIRGQYGIRINFVKLCVRFEITSLKIAPISSISSIQAVIPEIHIVSIVFNTNNKVAVATINNIWWKLSIENISNTFLRKFRKFDEIFLILFGMAGESQVG